jgi:mRNA interferase MazF
MIKEGQIVLFKLPQTDQTLGGLRPALVIRKLPNIYDDWLICMISKQVTQKIENFDEIIAQEDDDFQSSGLHSPSVIRISRLAVVDKNILAGTIGEINKKRLTRIKIRLAEWLKGT